MESVVPQLVAVAVVALAFLVVGLVVVARCIVVVQPNEAVVLSGRAHTRLDGTRVGYRVVTGGRVIRIPILETVSRIDLSNMAVEVDVRNAYANDGSALDVKAAANVKVSSDPGILHNAVERFLDRSRDEIRLVAQETLEGCLRQVVAGISPRALKADPALVAATLHEEAQGELNRLGLQLDVFKVKSVEGIAESTRRPVESEEPSAAPVATAPEGVSAPLAEATLDVDKLAAYALGRSEREALAARLVGQTAELRLTVERVGATTAGVPADYSGGQTLFCRRDSGLKVSVCLPGGEASGLADSKYGDEVQLRVRIHAWDERYAQLLTLLG